MKKKESELERFRKELLVLKRIGLIFGSTLQIDKVLSLVVEEICSLLEADRGSLFLVDHEKGILWSKIALKAEIEEINLPIGKGIAGYVAKSGEIINIKDAYKDPRFNPEIDKRTGYRTRSILCVPLRKPQIDREEDEEIIAVLQLLNKNSEDGFTDEDVDILLSLGGSLAILLNNTQLYNQLQKQFSQLQLFYEGEKIISSTENLELLLDGLLELYLKQFSLRSVGILLKQEQEFKIFSKLPDEKKPLTIHSLLVLPADFPFEISSPIWLEANEDSENNSIVQFLKDYGIQSNKVLEIPLRSKDAYYGLLLLDGDNISPEKNKILLELIASQITRAYELYLSRKSVRKNERLSALGTMMSAIVHDLRSPLNNIMGYVDLMTDEETSPEEREEYKEIINREIKSMVRMSNEILDYAKGKRTILPRKTGLHELTKDFEQRIRMSMQKNGIALHIEDVPRGVVRVDREKMLRAFVNIAKNAIEAMTQMEKGEKAFRFWVEKQKNNFVFHFRDTGPGIPDEMKHRIFQKFATSGKKEGTGLGLLNVKNIVKEHGGTIDFMSEKGVGTEFLISIPEYQK